jgi:hypothetical protein
MWTNFVTALALTAGMLGSASPGLADGSACPHGLPPSAAGICPVLALPTTSCGDAAAICGIRRATGDSEVVVSPPRTGSFQSESGKFKIQVNAYGSTLRVREISDASQQNGTQGFEAMVVKHRVHHVPVALVYCGTSVLDDVVKGPGERLSVCWASGPCGVGEDRVDDICAQYNPSEGPRTADFVQSYLIGPIEQSVNICGCAPAVAQFCDPRPPIGDSEEEITRFVACNPNNAPLKATESEAVSTEGSDTCIWMTMGGRRILVDKDGRDPRC